MYPNFILCQSIKIMACLPGASLLFSAHSLFFGQTLAPIYDYLVRFINPIRKSKFVTRTWHEMHDVFQSATELQKQLMKDFPEKLPTTLPFEVGYMEKNNAKRWIESAADLTAMYRVFQPGSSITIWCESKDDSDSADLTSKTATGKKKRKDNPDKDVGEPSKKRSTLSHEEDVDKFMEELRDKHSDSGKYSEPQLRLWARMMARGHHQSLDDPPNIPLITGAGGVKKPPKKDELSEVIITAAKAASQYFSLPSDRSHSSDTETIPHVAAGISPSSKAKISGMYLSHLKSLQELRASGVLTDEEFAEQKRYALKNIRGLNDK